MKVELLWGLAAAWCWLPRLRGCRTLECGCCAAVAEVAALRGFHSWLVLFSFVDSIDFFCGLRCTAVVCACFLSRVTSLRAKMIGLRDGAGEKIKRTNICVVLHWYSIGRCRRCRSIRQPRGYMRRKPRCQSRSLIASPRLEQEKPFDSSNASFNSLDDSCHLLGPVRSL